MASQTPETRYVQVGDLHVAYQVVGDGPVDLVFVREYFDHLEAGWDFPSMARFMFRLASFSRLIMFDKGGTGMSDPTALHQHPTLELWMDELRAVMDAVGSTRAAVVASGGAGPMAALFAATYPERVERVVFINTYARILEAPDYTQGESAEVVDGLIAWTVAKWGTGAVLRITAPTLADDDAFVAAYARLERMAASPGMVAGVLPMAVRLDVRDVLGTISVPTLVIHRAGCTYVRAVHGRYLAEHIAGARYVELPGPDYLIHVGDTDEMLDEIESFLTGTTAAAESDRALATVLFTDIVGSTDLAGERGDRRWRDLLDSHHALVRRQLARFQGREVDTAGDGFLATFDGPARAIRCACAIRDGVRSLGIEIRAGLHTGEVELRGDQIAGVAVHIGARVAAKAEPGEVLVSRTLVDLVAGSSIEFVDRGEHELKGVIGEWRLFAVAH
jgi:class 3 adenylate cyclase